LSQLDKFEEKANKIIARIGQLLSKLFLFLIPKKIMTFSHKRIENSKQKINTFKEKVNLKIKSLPSDLKQKSKTVIIVYKNITNKTHDFTEKLRHFDIKKAHKTSILAGIVVLFIPLAVKIKTWYLSLSPETFLAYLATGIFLSFASIQVYNSSMKIAEKNNPEKAIQVEKIDDENTLGRRPAYWNSRKKQFQVSHVTLPVYIETNSNIKSLVIDFTIEASNRYIREYFVKHEHLIKDRLNKTIEPVIPDFPLTLEGKIIIKTKIKKEIDKLLKDLNIEGEIKKITFHHIITG